MSPIAYTTPATAVAGTVLTASFVNTNLRDNIAWLATDSPACRAYRTTLLSTTSGAFSVVNLDSERFDNAAMHSTSSNTSRITIPSGGGGKYIFGGMFEFTNNATGNRQIIALLNGTTEICYSSSPGDASATTPTSMCATYALSVGDYIELRAWQNSGGALNLIVTGSRLPELWATWQRT